MSADAAAEGLGHRDVGLLDQQAAREQSGFAAIGPVTARSPDSVATKRSPSA